MDSSRVTCYRLGSIGEDTLLCLWDLTEDVLRKPSLMTVDSSGTASKSAASAISSTSSRCGSANHVGAAGTSGTASSNTSNGKGKKSPDELEKTSSEKTSLTQRLAALNFGDKKEHKRNFSLTGSRGDKANKGNGGSSTPTNAAAPTMMTAAAGTSATTSASVTYGIGGDERLRLGSAQYPRLCDVPLIEPLVCKKISRERLTSLSFLEDCFVTACQDGYVCTWARPGKHEQQQVTVILTLS